MYQVQTKSFVPVYSTSTQLLGHIGISAAGTIGARVDLACNMCRY